MPSSEEQRVTDALENLRFHVTNILEDGDDPTEVLALGTLVRRCAPPGINLEELRDALSNSTLGEVVGTVAYAIAGDDEEDLDPESDLDDVDELGEEPDLLGEN